MNAHVLHDCYLCDESDIEYIAVDVIAVSSRAVLVRADGGKKVWIPFKHIHSDSQVDRESKWGDEGMLAIPAWLAEERGLI